MQPGWIVGHQDAAPYNAVMDGGRLAGFFDWDTASPSSRDDDLAFSALLWVPLTAPDAGEQSGSHDVRDRSSRLHLLLDAYRYDSDRRAFGAVVVRRARRQAGVIRSMADAGDRASIALLPIASRLEQSASYVEALPLAADWGARPPTTLHSSRREPRPRTRQANHRYGSRLPALSARHQRPSWCRTYSVRPGRSRPGQGSELASDPKEGGRPARSETMKKASL
jgi:hypothetical protein